MDAGCSRNAARPMCQSRPSSGGTYAPASPTAMTSQAYPVLRTSTRPVRSNTNRWKASLIMRKAASRTQAAAPLPQRRAEKPCSQQKEGKIIGEKRHIPQRKRSLNIASGIGVQIFEKCDLFPRYIENMAVAKSAEDTAEEKQHGQEQREFLPCKLRAAAGQQNDRQKQKCKQIKRFAAQVDDLPDGHRRSGKRFFAR